MEVKELLIIYLAAGAPFAVYFFFRHRRDSHRLGFWLKIIFRFFVWFPYALLAAHRFFTQKTAGAFSRRSRKNDELANIKNEILREFIIQNRYRDFFETREVIERYIALTDTKNNFADGTARRETELFRISLRQNTELAARCLHRKNRGRVWQHQTQSQNDLYDLCSQNAGSKLFSEKICHKALTLTRLLGDQILEERITSLLKSASSEALSGEINNYRLKPAR